MPLQISQHAARFIDLAPIGVVAILVRPKAGVGGAISEGRNWAEAVVALPQQREILRRRDFFMGGK
ncbi:MAG: hypothetical protein IPN76_28585 [Saprospiraceae bacterium]|nr:hypothetical protein [Saprospiraceae bacterium]